MLIEKEGIRAALILTSESLHYKGKFRREETAVEERDFLRLSSRPRTQDQTVNLRKSLG